jgi:hypothetical protein
MDETDVIRLRLGRAEEMFQAPEWDISSPLGRIEPGIDTCIGELLSRRSRAPVRLEIELPVASVGPETATRLREAIARYCNERIARNDRDRRSARRTGYHSLRIGIPIALVGLALAVATTVANNNNEDFTLPNLAGWVLAWVGLWYPLDTIAFSSVGPTRENAVLARLREAETSITAF